jgi:hypothetical protein
MTPVRHHFAAVAETVQDPSTIPRLSGIEPSDDPLLELRAAVYLISGRGRRAAQRRAPSPNCHKPFGNEVGSNSVES